MIIVAIKLKGLAGDEDEDKMAKSYLHLSFCRKLWVQGARVPPDFDKWSNYTYVSV